MCLAGWLLAVLLLSAALWDGKLLLLPVCCSRSVGWEDGRQRAPELSSSKVSIMSAKSSSDRSENPIFFSSRIVSVWFRSPSPSVSHCARKTHKTRPGCRSNAQAEQAGQQRQRRAANLREDVLEDIHLRVLQRVVRRVVVLRLTSFKPTAFGLWSRHQAVSQRGVGRRRPVSVARHHACILGASLHPGYAGAPWKRHGPRLRARNQRSEGQRRGATVPHLLWGGARFAEGGLIDGRTCFSESTASLMALAICQTASSASPRGTRAG